MFDIMIPDIYIQLSTGLGIYFIINSLLDKKVIVLTSSVWFREKWFVQIVLLHNVALMLYSGWTFQKSILIMYQFMTWDDIFHPTIENTALFNSSFYDVAYYFYVSKYYEFLDTWIHYLKGRKPIFLQVFHHTGAVILMGIGILYKCHGIWVFVVFNSFVHTIMYFYYALSTIGIPFPLKSCITAIQITQFVIGIQFAVYYDLYTIQSIQQSIALKSLILYLVGLIYLFTDFYTSNYKKK